MMYTLFWLTGKRETVVGDNVASAMTKAGYSNGAVKALDFYAEGNNNEYLWDGHKRRWEKKRPVVLRGR
jgi:hypothetical protein